MANTRKQKHDKRKREAETDFNATKASFVAGILVITTIIIDCFKLFVSIPEHINITLSFISLIVCLLVMGTKIFDNILRSRKIAHFGHFLTLGSIVFFILENSVIRYIDIYSSFERIIIVITISGAFIVGALLLLLSKNNK